MVVIRGHLKLRKFLPFKPCHLNPCHSKCVHFESSLILHDHDLLWFITLALKREGKPQETWMPSTCRWPKKQNTSTNPRKYHGNLRVTTPQCHISPSLEIRPKLRPGHYPSLSNFPPKNAGYFLWRAVVSPLNSHEHTGAMMNYQPKQCTIIREIPQNYHMGVSKNRGTVPQNGW